MSSERLDVMGRHDCICPQINLRIEDETEKHALCICDWYANLIKSHSIEDFEGSPHINEVSRVMQIKEASTELGRLCRVE